MKEFTSNLCIASVHTLLDYTVSEGSTKPDKQIFRHVSKEQATESKYNQYSRHTAGKFVGLYCESTRSTARSVERKLDQTE